MDRRSLLTAAAVVPVTGLLLPEAAHAAPAGFNSTFNGSKAGWSNVRGTWTLKPGNLYSRGIPGMRVSTKRTGNYSDFYYAVRMRRRGNSTGVAANALVVRGNPGSVDGTGNWKPSYLFQYANQGWYSVWRINANGTEGAVVNWTRTSSVFSTGYNFVEVWVDGDYLDFHINGTHQWSGYDSALSFGQVGISYYTEPSKTAECFIDSASLTIIGSRREPCRLGAAGRAVPGGSINMAPR
ncbi:MAG TPA: hypothetical protein PKH97_11615 [Tetrasphaera sp.]|uniref:Uncharacterized protein n=1 Tax=Nostocoides vanveenii TaxID=330835 RepID=A0ABN2KQQ9_9MICO|nr:hypothetical protein [Tetrasphaera sp.]HNQ07821.1 hypothetical protein [Tetrasphaera sp.]